MSTRNIVFAAAGVGTGASSWITLNEISLDGTYLPNVVTFQDCAADSLGGVRVVGYASNSGYYNGFYYKYDSDGYLSSVLRLYTTSYSQLIYSVSLDSSDTAYVGLAQGISGASYQATTFKIYDDLSLSSPKYANASGGQNSYARKVVLQPASTNYYTAGYASDGSYMRGVAIKYNSAGSVTWTTRIDGPYGAAYFYNAAASTNNLFAVGRTQNGSGIFKSWVVKFASDGTKTWSFIYDNASGNASTNGVVEDEANGYIYTTGEWSDATYSKYAGVLQKINASTGALVFAKLLRTAPSNGDLYFLKSTKDSAGNIYTCGYYVDGDGNYHGIIVKYDTSGVVQLQRQLFPTATSGGRGVIFYGIAVTDDFIYAVGTAVVPGNPYGGFEYGIICKFKIDGSDTGEIGPFTYAASSLIEYSYSPTASNLGSYNGTLNTGSTSSQNSIIRRFNVIS